MINLQFNENQLNTVIGALVDRPFKEVAEVMQSIQQQIMMANQHAKQAGQVEPDMFAPSGVNGSVGSAIN